MRMPHLPEGARDDGLCGGQLLLGVLGPRDPRSQGACPEAAASPEVGSQGMTVDPGGGVPAAECTGRPRALGNSSHKGCVVVT